MQKDISREIENIKSILSSDTGFGEFIESIQQTETGVFDNFYSPFLKYFAEKIGAFKIKFLESTSIKVDFKSIIESALVSLKKDLISLSLKTLITDLYEKKSEGELLGEDSSKRYQYYNDLLLTKEYKVELLNRYSVLAYLIDVKISTKLNLLFEALQRLNSDQQILNKSLIGNYSIVKNIIFGSGDSHNGGKSVLIFITEQEEKLVYKPHSLLPEKSFNNILKWVYSKNALDKNIRSAIVIDCGDYGWQEFIGHKSCQQAVEVEGYYYRIGVLLSIFHMIKCGDIHHENIIAHGEYPVVVDLETLITNRNSIALDESLLGAFYLDIGNSILGTMLLPQNMNNSFLDIDISGLTGKGGAKSEKIVGHQLVNVGTDEIKLVPDYITTEENQNKVTLNNEWIDPAVFLENIEKGFSDCYNIFLMNYDELIGLIKDNKIFQGKYRQVLRATHIYAKFIEASYHPKYLKNFSDRYKLFDYLYNFKGILDELIREKEQKKTDAEVNSLINNDVPYFSSDLTTTRLYTNNIDYIEGYYEKTLIELLLERISKLGKRDMNKQLSYLRMSLAITEEINWGKEHANNDKSTKRFTKKIITQNHDFLRCAKDIGDYFFENAISNSNHNKCTWLTLAVQNDEKLRHEPLNSTLFEGGGLVLFLASLGKETGEEKYTKLARSALLGIEELWHQTDEIQTQPSVFAGTGSLVYIYYNLSVLWNDEKLYDKYIREAQKLLECNFNDDLCLDIIGGAAGIIICCLNIFREDKNDLLLDVSKKYGEFLYNKLTNSKDTYLTGLSHGYSGFSWALILLGSIINNLDYISFGMELIKIENAYFSEAKNNWNDLRNDRNEGDPVYWCHGASGIGLARVMVSLILGKAQTELIVKDIQNSICKLLSDGFNKEDNHSLCHGLFGNVDVLLEISQCLSDKNMLTKVYKHVETIINNVCNEGFRFGVGCSGEIAGFMLGLSGIGYTLLRLVNSMHPSVLTLDVYKKERV